MKKVASIQAITRVHRKEPLRYQFDEVVQPIPTMKTTKQSHRFLSKGLFALVCAAALFTTTAASAWDLTYPDGFSADSGSYQVYDGGSYMSQRDHASAVDFSSQQTWASGSVQLSGYDGDGFGVNLFINTDGVAPGTYLVATVTYIDNGWPTTIDLYVTID